VVVSSRLIKAKQPHRLLYGPLKFFLTFLVCQLLFTSSLPAQENGFVLRLDNADIDVLIRTVADRTGKNFVIDPNVRGKVTVLATQPMNKDELYQVFLSILQVHGYTAVKSGEVIKILPAKEAKQSGGTSQLNSRLKGDEFVTRIIKLTNSSATQVVSLLRPLVPKDGHIAASSDSNVLIISDRAENVARLVAIVSRIDNASKIDVKIFKLEHASASEIARIFNTLQIRGKGKFGGDISVIEDDRTNSVIVSASKEDLEKIKRLVNEMDIPSKGTGNAQVIYLKYAKAEPLVPVLLGVSEKLKTKTANKETTGSNKDISIQADKNSNALIITAPYDLFNSLKGIVEKLDIRRAQVLVEAVIAEVSLNTARELGVEWVIDGTPGTNSAVGFINFGSLEGMIGAISAIDQGNTPSLPSGTSVGFGREGSSVNFAAFLRALNSDSATNVLSTPSILTLDNAEAEIVVGENVPFISGEYTSTATSTVNPFRTINREDVGLSLKVTPQINEGNAVQLEIEQEITSVIPGAEGATDLTTSKRRIKTTVLVEDQEIVVLGGLIDDSLQETQSKVPLLGDIPLLGSLFRYNKASKIKRNLMVFIKPVIIRDDATISQITGEKYSYLRAKQIAEKEEGVPLMPKDASPVLPNVFIDIPPPFNYTDTNNQ
jgi:general secretion pathway protein D